MCVCTSLAASFSLFSLFTSAAITAPLLAGSYFFRLSAAQPSVDLILDPLQPFPLTPRSHVKVPGGGVALWCAVVVTAAAAAEAVCLRRSFFMQSLGRVCLKNRVMSTSTQSFNNSSPTRSGLRAHELLTCSRFPFTTSTSAASSTLSSVEPTLAEHT